VSWDYEWLHLLCLSLGTQARIKQYLGRLIADVVVGLQFMGPLRVADEDDRVIHDSLIRGPSLTVTRISSRHAACTILGTRLFGRPPFGVA
jgi:hypothetical protein